MNLWTALRFHRLLNESSSKTCAPQKLHPVHGELLKIAKCQAFSSLFLILPDVLVPYCSKIQLKPKCLEFQIKLAIRNAQEI